MREIWMQKAAPPEMYHSPDSTWLRYVVRSNVRIYVIARLQTTGTRSLVGALHSKLSWIGDSPLRTNARESKPFLKLIEGCFPILASFFVGARWW
jgi:hypothetical protein